MAELIDGRASAERLVDYVRSQVETIRQTLGRTPGLATVLVGDDPASHVYVRSKACRTRDAGMVSRQHRLPADVPQSELLALVEQLNGDEGIDGILVQLPLPAHIDATAVINAVDPRKDVDGFHASNVGLLTTGQRAMAPLHALGLPADAARAPRVF